MEEAFPIYRQVLTNDPLHSGANYKVGKKLLRDGDDTGLPLIQEAIDRDFDWVVPGINHIYNYWLEQGQSDKAKEYLQSQSNRLDTFQIFEAFRTQLSYYDMLRPYQLDVNELVGLVNRLKRHSEVLKGYLTMKETSEQLYKSVYVLVLEFNMAFIKDKKDKENVIESIARKAPANTIIIDMDEITDVEFIRHLKNLNGSKIYP